MEQKTFNYYGYGYKIVNQKEVLLIDGALARGKVIIPSEVEDPEGNKYTVVGLGTKTMTFSELIQPDDKRKKSFYKTTTYSAQRPFMTVQNGRKVLNKEVTELILPDTTRKLCSLGATLKSFSIPNGVTEIPQCFHWGGDALKNIIIPDSVTIIGERAFAKTGLLSIKFPPQLEEIPVCCCSECKDLVEVTLPDKLKKIGICAFAGCAFETIDIPSSVTHIDEGAFYGKDCERYILAMYYTEERLKTVNIFNDEGAVIIHPKAFGPNVQINYMGVKHSSQQKVLKPETLDKEGVENRPQIDLDKLIEAVVVDGVVTDKERTVVLKKASAAGYDADEVEILLDAKLYEIQQSTLSSKQIEPTPKQQRSAAPETKTTEPVALDLAEAKRKKGNLQVRISDWKKKGKDVTILQQELAELNEYIKNQK